MWTQAENNKRKSNKNPERQQTQHCSHKGQVVVEIYTASAEVAAQEGSVGRENR